MSKLFMPIVAKFRLVATSLLKDDMAYAQVKMAHTGSVLLYVTKG